MKIAVINRELFLLLLTIAQCRNAPTTTSPDGKEYWYAKNMNDLKARMRTQQTNSLPKVQNVIIFIGDGMGLTTITASRTLKSQITENPNARMTFDHFPATALMKTDIINSQIPESAASSTALFCGVKTNFESLGVDTSGIGRELCKHNKSHTPSIFTWAQEQNLKTGFVTTSRITHATPAALYAHARRHTEDDSKNDSFGCDIATQLIENETGKNINVIMGGGMRSFIPESAGGRRKDEKNLTNEWIEKHPNGQFVSTRNELLNIENSTEHLLGIFAESHMRFNADRNKEIEPSLAEMTKIAIDLLKRNNPNGFILVVEGAKIDLAHHYNIAFRALDETLQLDEAIDVAWRNVDFRNSLIIVTSDHASAMSYSGFATPKSLSVLGMDKYVSNIDGKPYQLLTYSSGHGHSNYNETIAKQDYRNAFHKAAIPSTWSHHAADDVPLYAIGSMANLLFSGTFDQTYLAHAVAYAMCIFKYSDRCTSQNEETRFAEKKLRGYDAVRQALKDNPHGRPGQGNNIDGERIKEVTLTEQVKSNEKFNAEIYRNETFLDEKFESSDLIGNTTDNDENSSSKIHSNLFVLAVIMLINVVFCQ